MVAIPITSEVKSQSNEICHKLQAYLTYHGYDTHLSPN